MLIRHKLKTSMDSITDPPRKDYTCSAVDCNVYAANKKRVPVNHRNPPCCFKDNPYSSELSARISTMRNRRWIPSLLTRADDSLPLATTGSPKLVQTASRANSLYCT